MISTNVMSFMKKIVKAGEDEGSGGSGSGGGSAGGATAATGGGGGSAGGTIGKLRQTVASGMKEIREKAVPAVSGGGSAPAPVSTASKSPPPSRGDLRHLTDEEKTILQQVWKKEAEFEKESIHQKAKPAPTATPPPPVSPQPRRDARPKACRICRKSMTYDEKYYTCVACGQGVCDDCASYRKDPSEEEEGWKCSFCRRRQDRLGVEPPGGSGMRRVPSAQRMAQSMEDSRTDSTESMKERSPPPSERIRRGSSKSETLETFTTATPSEKDPHSPKVATSNGQEALKSTPTTTTQQTTPKSAAVILNHVPAPDQATNRNRQQEGSRKPQSVHPTPKISKQESYTSQRPNSPKTSQPNVTSSQERTLSRASSVAKTDSTLAMSGSKALTPKHAIQPSQQSATMSDIQKQCSPQTSTSSISRPSVPQKRTLSPTDKHISSSSTEVKPDRKEYSRSSRPGSPIPERLQDVKLKSGSKSPIERTRSSDVYAERSAMVGGHSAPGQAPSSSPYPKIEMERKHSSLEGPPKERRPSLESQKGLRVSPQPPQLQTSPSTSTRQYRLRMSSASESSLEERSPEDDAERRRRNRMRRRSRFQRQKTFVDEHDSDGREEWMSGSYNVTAANDEDVNSSFDSSSAFESFDNEAEVPPPRHAGHSAGYVSSGSRPIRHISSDAALYQRRRSSDSSDISDISAEMAAYGDRTGAGSGYRSDHMQQHPRRQTVKGVAPRRQHPGRGTASDYESDVRYAAVGSIDISSLDDRSVVRNRMEKSLSVDDPEVMGSRISARRALGEVVDDRRRLYPHDYVQQIHHSSSSGVYQFVSTENRGYQNQTPWTRSARSLELTLDTPEIRRASLAEGESIKIVIDDVDEERKRDKDWNEPLNWSYDDGFETTSLNITSRHKASSASDVSGEMELLQSVGGRRRLPMIPDQGNYGEIGIQIWYDHDRLELVVTIFAAKGLKRRKGSVGTLPQAYAKLRMLPYSGFRPIKTLVAEATTSPEWNKTCIFPGITMDEILDKVLEVSVWDIEQNEDIKMLMGVVNIPLGRADLKDSLEWYPLTNRPLTLLSNPPKALSTGMLVSTPAHDMARRLLSRTTQREMLQSQSLTDEGPGECYDTDEEQGMVKSTSMDSTLLQPEDVWDQGASDEGGESVSGMMGTQKYSFNEEMSQQLSSRRTYPLATQDSLPDVYCSDLESTEWQRRGISYDRRCVNSDTEGGNNVMYRQRSRNSIRRRIIRGADTRAELGARSVVLGDPNIISDHCLDPDNSGTMASLHLPSVVRKMGPEKTNHRVTTSNVERSKLGELKLGLAIQRGQLSVEVIKARGIKHTPNGHPPDTYVKTYLKDGEGKGIKRKTSVVRQSTEPKFHQTLKYGISDVRHKTLLAMIWERHKRFEHNQPIGMVELDLEKMELNKPLTGWYRLYPLASSDAESLGSA